MISYFIEIIAQKAGFQTVLPSWETHEVSK